MQEIQEHQADRIGEVPVSQDMGIQRNDSELPTNASVEKIHKVLVGIPLKGHTPSNSYHDRMIMWKYLGNQEVEDFYKKKNPRYVFSIGCIGEILTPFAREKLAEAAIEAGCEYLFMVDDDMLCPPDLFYKLVAHDKDIVAALAFTRNPDHKPVIYETVEGFDPITRQRYGMTRFVLNYPKNKLVECDAVGFGAVLIKTEVFKKTPKPWFFGMAQTGEDLTICLKARKAGFRVWMDTSIKLGHLGNPIIVTEEYSEQWNRMSDEEREKMYGRFNKYETESMG